jgi:hypothetical protein
MLWTKKVPAKFSLAFHFLQRAVDSLSKRLPRSTPSRDFRTVSFVRNI